MTETALVGARIFAGETWYDEYALVMSNGRIKRLLLAKALPDNMPVQMLDGGVLLPGFVDTQVNGGGGVLFNDEPSVDGIISIAEAHRKFGTTAMLPTLISDDLDVIAKAIGAVDDAIQAGVPGIVGIHIEGPFLNPGKHGIHDAKKFRSLDADTVALLSSLKHGKTLVTLAPELAPEGAIAALVAKGVVVAAGHTLANYDDMQQAIGEGLSGVTHLFNAMTQMESRAPGVVGASMDGGLICGIIADGHHVHPASLRAAYRAKGSKELMLVTDAMPTVGSDITSFTVGGTAVTAREGMLRSDEGTLAGSDLDMTSALKNCVALMQVDLSSASQMASATPAEFIGIGNAYGRISEGYRADLVHLDDSLNMQNVWIAGDMA
ncbi:MULTISPECIES: N-acetylglucosamine-6-phosphate deacetylase [unclassified Sphingopyxis]|jgi:N-acetylglucosamine-6-phosphate deacetylase|uniref:N-acetylglucosamine-6-phosphate deacetylase n=1 Tax=unclassified Sphingopyxis TaxID=2614943 RepID=UPI0025DAFD1E|nr:MULTISPECIES: N-acetylglucosamine-6-phosphate deacetylase [unclassified Sphingopyxis]